MRADRTNPAAWAARSAEQRPKLHQRGGMKSSTAFRQKLSGNPPDGALTRFRIDGQMQVGQSREDPRNIPVNRRHGQVECECRHRAAVSGHRQVRAAPDRRQALREILRRPAVRPDADCARALKPSPCQSASTSVRSHKHGLPCPEARHPRLYSQPASLGSAEASAPRPAPHTGSHSGAVQIATLNRNHSRAAPEAI